MGREAELHERVASVGWAWKLLCERVSEHVVGRAVHDLDDAVGNVFLETVDAEVNELAAFAVDRVLGHHAHSAVVAVEGRRCFLRELDVLEAAAEPQGLVAGLGGGDILGLCGRRRDARSLL